MLDTIPGDKNPVTVQKVDFRGQQRVWLCCKLSYDKRTVNFMSVFPEQNPAHVQPNLALEPEAKGETASLVLPKVIKTTLSF